MSDYTREEVVAKIAAGESLEGAHLSKAFLFEATLWKADLRGAKYNAKTIWPEGFEPEGTGAVLAED